MRSFWCAAPYNAPQRRALQRSSGFILRAVCVGAMLPGLACAQAGPSDLTGPMNGPMTGPMTGPTTEPTTELVPASATSGLTEPQARSETVVVTATRIHQNRFDVPAAIDTVGTAAIQNQQLRTNASESLTRVPGLVVQNRQNYAQDLQISSRGFGARAQFGVRGVRLLQDGIPLTMPDGQGQTGMFDLDAARRIEVLRGPLSALYGNASGGIVQLFTEDAPEHFTLAPSMAFGSDGTARAALKFGGRAGALQYSGNVSRFETDGYRDHSAARRDLANVKLRFAPDADSRLTFIFNALDQPDTQDALGLTEEQYMENPRQATAVAEIFDTRKSIRHEQAGLHYERRVSDLDRIVAMGYVGQRKLTQYQSFTGSGTFQAGGVVDLDRDFGGAELRWTRTMNLAHGPFSVSAGLEYGTLDERRKGFINNFGVAGALRRDEDDAVRNNDQVVQAEWWFARDWKLSGGVRHSAVTFESDDHYLADGSDNSGSVRYASTNPVVGLLYRVSPGINLYAAAGRGFETPTFLELAYRADGPGLNFDLEPSRSKNVEFGIKMVFERANFTAALFQSRVQNEIVPGPVQAGTSRSTFVNAARSTRKGLELQFDAQLAEGLTTYWAYTRVDARFDEYETAAGMDLAGKRLPGVPRHNLYGELAWRHAPSGFSTGLEARHVADIVANDLNDSFAPSYTVANWRGGFTQNVGHWRFAEFVRIDNLADKAYVGSVIVNGAGARYFEPAPGRTWLAGINVQVAFP